jgi:hypothetical protein
MKKFVLFFVAGLFSFSVYAADKPKDVDDKMISYYKILAKEELKIIEKYIDCLDSVNNKKGVQLCNRKKGEMLNKLRKSASQVKSDIKQNRKQ